MMKEFQTESRRLLELMIHSVYANREVFLRELISNASDALDKLAVREEPAITLSLDKENRRLTVSDNGIGMDEAELEEDLGVIASSGSARFPARDDALIGQFGLGFYSAFLVADQVEVVSRKYGSEDAFCWASSGSEGFTVTPAAREGHGTDVILHIRPDGEEQDEFSRYLREYPLYKLVKKHSDFIRYPIRMLMPRPQENEEVWAFETLNSMTPLWQRSEATREEQEAFYRERYGDPQPLRAVISVSAEGAVSCKALLFIPAGPSPDPGLSLYSSGVLIMERCKSLLPECFHFVRGVVDAPELSLNISRETLQEDGQVKRLAALLEKKVRAELERMKKGPEYLDFYRAFGRQLKHCALDEEDGPRREYLKELLMFWSSTRKELTTLEDYVNRMAEGQRFIYCAAGGSVAELEQLPQTELLRRRGTEILYFTDKVDEFVPGLFRTYRGKPFRSALEGGPAKADGAHRKTLDFVKKNLGDKVDQVVPSGRLHSHPVCMSSGSGITFEMEKYFTANQPERKLRAKRILELNLEHPALLALERAITAEPERAAKYAEILYSQGMLLAGMPLESMSDYTDLLCSLW